MLYQRPICYFTQSLKGLAQIMYHNTKPWILTTMIINFKVSWCLYSMKSSCQTALINHFVSHEHLCLLLRLIVSQVNDRSDFLSLGPLIYCWAHFCLRQFTPVHLSLSRYWDMEVALLHKCFGTFKALLSLLMITLSKCCNVCSQFCNDILVLKQRKSQDVCE